MCSSARVCSFIILVRTCGLVCPYLELETFLLFVSCFSIYEAFNQPVLCYATPSYFGTLIFTEPRYSYASVCVAACSNPSQYRNGPGCTMATQTPKGQTCVYEDVLFEERVTQVIEGHTNTSAPLMVFWATHIVHGPLQGVSQIRSVILNGAMVYSCP